jgi:nucleoside-diphosphate-sugar epimerase
LTDSDRDPGLDALPADAWRAIDIARLAGERLFVTGATGFVGRWLLAAIGRLNATAAIPIGVRALARSAAEPHADWLTWVRGDVRDYRDEASSTFIVHAALPSTAARSDRDAELRDVALRGAESVIRHARRAGTRRIVVLSSGAVYGPQQGAVTEDTPARAGRGQDAYADAKRDVEAMFDAERGADREIVLARLFTCIGCGYRNHGHLAHVGLLDAARTGRPIALRGDGTAVRSYLFGADLAVWLLVLLAGSGSDVVNVGSDEAITIGDFARLVARVAGRREDDVAVGADRDTRRPWFVPDIARARRQYGLAPWTPVARAVSLTLAAGSAA